MLGRPGVRPVAGDIDRLVDDQPVDIIVKVQRIERLDHDRQQRHGRVSPGYFVGA